MIPTILTWDDIKPIVAEIDLVHAMEEAFIAYSRKRAVIPPVGELIFDKPPGDVHLKYGYLKQGDYYVIKIASGFYNNPQLGIPSSQGLMLLFKQTTGQLASVLLDEGNLTDLRTAAAGAVAAKHLGPNRVACIGIIGTGIQAIAQLTALKTVTKCRKAVVWGRSENNVATFIKKANNLGFNTQKMASPEALCQQSNLIVTTTPSTKPLIQFDWVQPGTHITAVGADTANKQELDAALLSRASLVAVDSLSQSRTRGEVYRAVNSNELSRDDVVELGEVIDSNTITRKNSSEITVTDLTGVAVQDLSIARAVFLGVSAAS